MGRGGGGGGVCCGGGGLLWWCVLWLFWGFCVSLSMRMFFPPSPLPFFAHWICFFFLASFGFIGISVDGWDSSSSSILVAFFLGFFGLHV